MRVCSCPLCIRTVCEHGLTLDIVSTIHMNTPLAMVREQEAAPVLQRVAGMSQCAYRFYATKLLFFYVGIV